MGLGGDLIALPSRNIYIHMYIAPGVGHLTLQNSGTSVVEVEVLMRVDGEPVSQLWGFFL